MIDLEKLKSKPSFEIEELPCPELDDVIYVKCLSSEEALKLFDQRQSAYLSGEKRMREWTIASLACNQDGVLIFDRTNDEHLNVLKDQRASFISRVYAECIRLNPLTTEDVVRYQTKKYRKPQVEDSSTD